MSIALLERPARPAPSPLLAGRHTPALVHTPERTDWVSKGRTRPFAGGGALSASGLFYISFRDMFQNDSAIDVLADTIKFALFTNSITTPNFDTNTGYGAAPFNANEIPNGSGYTTGGVAIANDTITVSSGTLIYDGDDSSWTTATFSGVRGGAGYDDTITTPVADPLLWVVTFGADFAVTAGTFTVQWAAGGIWAIDLTP